MQLDIYNKTTIETETIVYDIVNGKQSTHINPLQVQYRRSLRFDSSVMYTTRATKKGSRFWGVVNFCFHYYAHIG